MKVCPTCGEKLRDDVKYCITCGSVVQPGKAVQGADANLSVPIKNPEAGMKFKVIIGALLAIILITSGIWGWKSFGTTTAWDQSKLELGKADISDNKQTSQDISKNTKSVPNPTQTVTKNKQYNHSLDDSLISAVREKNVNLAKSLLAQGADPDTVDGSISALSIAIDKSDVEMVTVLLANGANPKGKNTAYGYTVLGDAVFGGIPEIVEMLLEAGADVTARDVYAQTPLCYAMDAYPTNGGTDAQKAECVKVILGAGADINARSSGGSTPLIQAARWGQIECMKVLLAAGADVTLKDDSGYTALGLSETLMKRNVSDLLRQYGAKE